MNGKQPPLPIHLAARSGKGAAALALAEGGATLGAAGSVAQSAAEIARSSHFPELASILEKIEKKKKPKAAATPKAAPSKKRH